MNKLILLAMCLTSTVQADSLWYEPEPQQVIKGYTTTNEKAQQREYERQIRTDKLYTPQHSYKRERRQHKPLLAPKCY